MSTDELVGDLFPEEAASVARAVAKRTEEFRRGRVCARRALSELGVPPSAIPVGVSSGSSSPA